MAPKRATVALIALSMLVSSQTSTLQNRVRSLASGTLAEVEDGDLGAVLHEEINCGLAETTCPSSDHIHVALDQHPAENTLKYQELRNGSLWKRNHTIFADTIIFRVCHREVDG